MEGKTENFDLSNDKDQLEIKMKLRVFVVPPINDALVVGKNAPIGSEAWRRALVLLQVAPFESIKMDDDTIEEILVQKRILKKIPKDDIIKIILKRIKPFMSPEEVIHLDISAELTISEKI